MKTTLLLILLSFGVTTFTVASAEPGMALRKQREPGMYTLIYKTEKKSNLTMIVYDRAGNLLFKDLILNSNGFIRTLNFKFLLPGEYSIDVIDQEGSKKTQKVDHKIPVQEADPVVL